MPKWAKLSDTRKLWKVLLAMVLQDYHCCCMLGVRKAENCCLLLGVHAVAAAVLAVAMLAVDSYCTALSYRYRALMLMV